MGNNVLPIAHIVARGIILAQFWHQFDSKVLPIALTVAHCQCCPLQTPTIVIWLKFLPRILFTKVWLKTHYLFVK
jgi:hypothetical protein